jgi:hypothetical protein
MQRRHRHPPGTPTPPGGRGKNGAASGRHSTPARENLLFPFTGLSVALLARDAGE